MWTRSRCCASSWRSTTQDVASRFRCPSRRPTRGRWRVIPATSPNRRRGTGGSPAIVIPPRTRRRRTYGHGATVPTCQTLSMRAWTRYSRAGVAADAARRKVGVMDRFDLLGPLPAANSTTVLEASAGTGKTFALAGLVTRYVAEGAATLDQMLLITFGRAASQELRERVRDQIVARAQGFRRPVAGRRQPGGRAPARGFGRPARDAATQPAGCVGELRRGDDRDHAPVLPAGAEIAWRGR